MRKLSILSVCLVLALAITQSPWSDVTSNITRGADAIGETPNVMTPYGLVSRSEVTEVSRDEVVRVVGDRRVKFDLNTNAKIADLGPASDAASAERTHADTNTLRNSAAAAEQNLSGRHAWAPAEHIKEYRTTWTVPPKPVNPDKSGLFYIWPGLNRGGLQPVMEWRKFATGEGRYQMANWYIGTGTGYQHGKAVVVTPGDTVTAVITFMGMNNGKHVYKMSIVGYPIADVTVERFTAAKDVDLCFEPTGAAQYPYQWPAADKIRFRDITLVMQAGHPTPPTLKWFVRGDWYPTPSGKNTVIVNNSTSGGIVDIYFR